MVPLIIKRIQKSSKRKKHPVIHVVRTVRKTERIAASKQSGENEKEPGHFARNEMDTHADTCCAGANWVPLEFTGEICEVKRCMDS